MGEPNMDNKTMDAEMSALFVKIPGMGDNAYPSHELRVSNEFIKRHPEYEKSRTEVYVSYVRVYNQMKKDGKLTQAQGQAPVSITARPAPSAPKPAVVAPKNPTPARPQPAPKPQPLPNTPPPPQPQQAGTPPAKNSKLIFIELYTKHYHKLVEPKVQGETSQQVTPDRATAPLEKITRELNLKMLEELLINLRPEDREKLKELLKTLKQEDIKKIQKLRKEVLPDEEVKKFSKSNQETGSH